MDDKVHQLVFIHLLCVEVGDEEADVIALKSPKEEIRKQGLFCVRHIHII